MCGKKLFVGITSWNSEEFLPRCIRAIQVSTEAQTTKIVVLDNGSEDASVTLARDLGATVLVEPCSQADALNRLVSLSGARYTLLIHADVIMLSRSWFALCRSKITGEICARLPRRHRLRAFYPPLWC